MSDFIETALLKFIPNTHPIYTKNFLFGITYVTLVIKLKFRKRHCGVLTGYYRPTQEINFPCSPSNRK
jgi:hypothetical protein